MASDLKLQVAGLYTSNNPFSAAKPGAMAQADNTVINAEGVLESRRGVEELGYTFGTGSDVANTLGHFGSTLLVQYGTKLARDTGAALTDYSGTYTPVDNTLARMRMLPSGGNLYLNCQDGTRRLETAAGTPAQAGVPRATRVAAVNVSTNGWQTYNTAVRYRAVWGYKDAQGKITEGVPVDCVLENRIFSFAPAGVVNGVTRTAPDGSHPAGKVTVWVDFRTNTGHNLQVGDTVVLSPGEANFAAGTKTVVTATTFTFTYNEAGANVGSTVDQDFQKVRSASVRIDIPTGITTSHFYRLYRSDESATAATVPSGECFLVYEGQPSAGDIVAGYVTVSDITPTDFNVAQADPCYTNSNTGQGVLASNERPPVALDIRDWDGRTWWANTTQRRRLELQMLGVGSPNGIQNNDTLTIGSRVYTFKTVTAVANDVAIWTSTLSPGVMIKVTAEELCRVINADTSSLVYAYYVSGENDNPGKIFLEERAIGGSSITVTASRVASWNPALPATMDNDAKPHGLMYSKPDQPDAVPVVNEVLVGSKNYQILRIAPLRSALVVFKTDGIWTVTGTNGRYSADRIGVAKLLAPETVQVFADKVWGLTDQGLTTVTDGGGVAVTSYNIESDITSLFGGNLSNLKRYAFGVGYESDRRYMLWLPEDTNAGGTGQPTQCYNYNTATRTWTRWTRGARYGVLDVSADKLVIASDTTNHIYVERKNLGVLSFLDYCDESFTATISSLGTSTVTMNTSAHGIVAGDMLNSGGFSLGAADASRVIVTAVNGAVLTVNTTPATYLPASGTVTVYKGIDCRAVWHPVTLGNPAQAKTHHQASYLWKGYVASLGLATFTSDGSSSTDAVTLTPLGTMPVLGSPSYIRSLRVAPLPRDHADCAQLSVGFRIREAGSQWKLHGVVVEAEGESERRGR